MYSETRFQKLGILKRTTKLIISLERTKYNAPNDSFQNELYLSFRDSDIFTTRCGGKSRNYTIS